GRRTEIALDLPQVAAGRITGGQPAALP
ncbi:MAG: hypothetical protein QOE38_229, partial [Thermoleophilaceae bacterium]|nr:hypothetical protein [Thermoleophilaceae bacterium]